MTDRTESLRVAISAEEGPTVAPESLLARFLIGELETSNGINELLELFDGLQQSVARRLAGRAAESGANARASARDDQFASDLAYSWVAPASESPAWAFGRRSGGISATRNMIEPPPSRSSAISAHES
jgi:hypothetical protein